MAREADRDARGERHRRVLAQKQTDLAAIGPLATTWGFKAGRVRHLLLAR